MVHAGWIGAHSLGRSGPCTKADFTNDASFFLYAVRALRYHARMPLGMPANNRLALLGYFFFVPLAIGFLLAYVGAFETAEHLDGFDAAVYWLPNTWVAWVTVFVVSVGFVRLLRRSQLLALALGCAVASVLVSFQFYWVEANWFPQLVASALQPAMPTGLSHAGPGDVLAVYYPMVSPLVFLLALPLNARVFAAGLFARHAAVPVVRLPVSADARDGGVAVPGSGEASAPALLDKLPAALGREIHYVEAQQHYLKVCTARGTAMVHHRLSDAVNELGSSDGLRVHRSFWVARAALLRAERDKGRVWLHLTGGRRIPVSRSYQVAVKEAGWLEPGAPDRSQ